MRVVAGVIGAVCGGGRGTSLVSMGAGEVFDDDCCGINGVAGAMVLAAQRNRLGPRLSGSAAG